MKTEDTLSIRMVNKSIENKYTNLLTEMPIGFIHQGFIHLFHQSTVYIFSYLMLNYKGDIDVQYISIPIREWFDCGQWFLFEKF